MRIGEFAIAIAWGATLSCAQAATLRPMTTLHAPVVKLSDLFDDAGAKADRVLGPAPAPGGRIVVESRQLGAIARQFGVSWRPAFGSERAVLERPGRILTREEMLPVLKQSLISAGASPDADIDVPAVDPPMVPAEGTETPVVTHLDYSPGTGRFTALFEIAGPGMDPVSWRVSGHATTMAEVPVPVARLLPGTVLRASDLHLAKLPASRVPAGAVRDIADAVGKELRYQAAPDVPLTLNALATPMLVKRNGRVLILAGKPGLSLSMEGRALESGAAGDHVRVLNPASRAVLDAVVFGDGRVRVDPEAPPLEIARPGAAGTEYVK